MPSPSTSSPSRRHFFLGPLFTAAIPTAGFGSSPSLTRLGYKSPNELLNIAAIGAGGKGNSDLAGCASENIVALCDVDDRRASRPYAKYPRAARYKDFRQMLDREARTIDAVIIATPDHTHAVATLACMQLGKHVYTQKPLTRTGATWNHIWTPNLIQSIRGAWNFALFKRDNPAQAGGEFLNKKYGIPGGNSDIPGGFTQMALTGYRALGIGAFNPVDRDSQNRQLIGDLTWTRGRHTVKAGASILRSQNNIYNIRTEVGAYTFNARFTTDGAADFLLGMASAYAWNTPLQVDLRMWNLGFYLQDDYKITPKLTLNLGLRYEVVLPFIDKRDRMGIFDTYTDPANPRLIFAGAEGADRYNRAMFHTDKNNWMPRVGFAYKLHNRTAIRGGFGMFYTYLEPFGDAEY